MKLQSVLFPREDICMEEKLYFHLEEDSSSNFNGTYFNMYKGEKVDFSTYFNGFSVGKWKKYTEIKDLFLQLEVEGEFLIELVSKEWKNDICIEKVILSCEKSTIGREKVEISYPSLEEGELERLYSFCIYAKSEQGIIYDGGYYTKTEPRNKVKLAADICTFRREDAVKRNLKILQREIF